MGEKDDLYPGETSMQLLIQHYSTFASVSLGKRKMLYLWQDAYLAHLSKHKMSIGHPLDVTDIQWTSFGHLVIAGTSFIPVV